MNKIIAVCVSVLCAHNLNGMHESRVSPKTVIATMWDRLAGPGGVNQSITYELQDMTDLEKGFQEEPYKPIEIINSSDAEKSPVFSDYQNADGCSSEEVCRKVAKYSLIAAVGLSSGLVIGATFVQYFLS